MTKRDEWAALDATAQAELVRSGEVTALEMVESAIERLERLDPILNAVIHKDLARARARAADPRLPNGPFRGVPFLMKDIGGEEAGQPLHAGMKFLERADYRPEVDAFLTQKFVAAGLVSLGRTNTPELALLPTTESEAHGATRNPWNLEYSAGGSSGGSAAAVAAGIVAAAHASDGGGSIRGPAAKCSLVGLKPTRGRNSFGPGLGERWSGFSSEFVVTRSVRDTAALLDVTAGAMPGDPYTAPLPGESFASAVEQEPRSLRIGFMTAAPRDIEVDPQLVAATERLARRLADLGHTVEEAHPAALDDPSIVVHYITVVACNVARALAAYGDKVGATIGEDDVEPLTWSLAESGRAVPAPKLLESLEFVHGLGRRLASWWASDGFDILLTPTQAMPPVRLGQLGSTREAPLQGLFRSAPYGVFTLPFNLSGQPAISLPGGFSEARGGLPAGLPLGLQLIAAFGEERRLLSLAAQVEAAHPWADARPPVFG